MLFVCEYVYSLVLYSMLAQGWPWKTLEGGVFIVFWQSRTMINPNIYVLCLTNPNLLWFKLK